MPVNFKNFSPFFEGKKLLLLFSKKKKPDIIITDSFALAVGLKYDSNSMQAPVIKFKSKNKLTQKIIEAGKSKNIPVIDSPKLASDLFNHSRVSQYIPYKHYNEVAQIYGDVFKNNEENEKEDKAKRKNNFLGILNEKRGGDLEIFSILHTDKAALELSQNLSMLLKGCSFTAEVLGFQVKNIKVSTNDKLNNEEYLIKINGLTAKQGFIKYTFIEPYKQICLQLQKTIAKHSGELIGRDDIVHFLEKTNEQYPILVAEVMNNFSTGDIRRIILGLLEENAPIQNLPLILETIADFDEKEYDIDQIIERVRISIGRDICYPLLRENNILPVISFSHDFELLIKKHSIETDFGKTLDPAFNEKFLSIIIKAVESAEKNNIKPVFLCKTEIRKTVFKSINKIDAQLAVLSLPEINRDITIQYFMELESL